MATRTEFPDFPKTIGVLYFPHFEVLDIAGPLQALNTLSDTNPDLGFELSIISRSMDPVSAGSLSGNKFREVQCYLPTHTFETAPPIDALFIPGGLGGAPNPPMKGGSMAHFQDYLDFINDVYHGKNGKQPLKHLITICNGAGIIAAAGVLDGHKATTNKAFWEVLTSLGPKTHWIAKARWIQSGNIWTTSGVSAGADGTLAWIESLLGKKYVDVVTNWIEWRRAEDWDNDPFQKIFGAEDILPQ